MRMLVNCELFLILFNQEPVQLYLRHHLYGIIYGCSYTLYGSRCVQSIVELEKNDRIPFVVEVLLLSVMN